MSRTSRRTFLKTSAAALGAATFAIGSTRTSGQVVGANDAIRVAVVGVNGRGKDHIDEYLKIPGVRVTCLVDPDSRLFESRAGKVEKASGTRPKCVQDIREALDDANVDAISVATPNHWHSLATVWACQAGKDVYVEKPCSHNVFEGRQCVEAARKYGRIVQHGTQSRSSDGTARETSAARSGKYGKLLVAKGYCCKPRWSIAYKSQEEPPKELDFNLWLGPAPQQPYHGNLVHYNWHWFWDFGNGDQGNQGVHQMDIARWGIGQGLPKAVWGLGCRYVNEKEKDFRDQGQTPNMELCVYDYGETLLVFETRGLVGKNPEFPARVENEFYTSEGVIRGGKFFAKGSDKGEDLKIDAPVFPGGHFPNFIHCVRSRKADELNAPIQEGHFSAALCHLGNISYRLGRDVPFSQEPDLYMDNAQVRESWAAIRKNLEVSLGMDLGKFSYQLGPKLTFDPEREDFVGNADASALLTRAYRDPFVVPKI